MPRPTLRTEPYARPLVAEYGWQVGCRFYDPRYQESDMWDEEDPRDQPVSDPKEAGWQPILMAYDGSTEDEWPEVFATQAEAQKVCDDLNQAEKDAELDD